MKLVTPCNADAFLWGVVIFLFLSSLVGIISSISLLRPDAPEATISAMRLRTELGPEENVAVIASIFRITAFFTMLVSMLTIVATVGISRRKESARSLAVWLSLVLCLWWGMSAISVFVSPWRSGTALLGNLIGAFGCGIIVMVLTHRTIRKEFPQPLVNHAQHLRVKRSFRQ